MLYEETLIKKCQLRPRKTYITIQFSHTRWFGKALYNTKALH